MSMMKPNPWEEIQIPTHDIKSRRIDHEHPLDFYWSRDIYGRYLFYCKLDKGLNLPNQFPDLKGINIHTNQERNKLILSLKQNENWEIFLSLCNDILWSTQDTDKSKSVSKILERLLHWQNFLKKERSQLLTEERIKGLIGELLFIRNYLIPVFGSEQSIKFWQGPAGNPQDFNVNDIAIEAKCQSGNTRPTVRISSADQLCSQVPELYLYVVTLGTASDDTLDLLNISTLVDNIRTVLKSDSANNLDRFNDLLLLAGYSDTADYSDYLYILSGDIMYEVSEGFPRICPDTLQSGIENLTYSINLSACKSFEGSPSWVKKQDGH